MSDAMETAFVEEYDKAVDTMPCPPEEDDAEYFFHAGWQAAIEHAVEDAARAAKIADITITATYDDRDAKPIHFDIDIEEHVADWLDKYAQKLRNGETNNE